jgi:hypothetical protein
MTSRIEYAKNPIQAIYNYVKDNQVSLSKKNTKFSKKVKYIKNFMDHEIRCRFVEKKIIDNKSKLTQYFSKEDILAIMRTTPHIKNKTKSLVFTKEQEDIIKEGVTSFV